jgi:DNA-binding transcriptional regulator YdaS (Cro superfamily)
MYAAMNLNQYLEATATTQARFARIVGVTQGRVSQWVKGAPIPAERCRVIESATNGQVSVHELRPDVFGVAPSRVEAA